MTFRVTSVAISVVAAAQRDNDAIRRVLDLIATNPPDGPISSECEMRETLVCDSHAQGWYPDFVNPVVFAPLLLTAAIGSVRVDRGWNRHPEGRTKSPCA